MSLLSSLRAKNAGISRCRLIAFSRPLTRTRLGTSKETTASHICYGVIGGLGSERLAWRRRIRKAWGGGRVPLIHVPVHVDHSTLVVTSIASAAVAWGVCRAISLTQEVSLAIALVVGGVLYASGVIPIGLLVVIGVAAVAAVFKWMFVGGQAKSTSQPTTESKEARVPTRGPRGNPRVHSDPSDVAVEHLPDYLCRLTLNSPDEDSFNDLLAFLPQDVSDAEKARLRVCIVVAHIVLLLRCLHRAEAQLGDISSKYLERLRAELTNESIHVRVEDIVVAPDELWQLVMERTRLKERNPPATDNGNWYLPTLIECLIEIRGNLLREAIEADFAKSREDGIRLPLMKTSTLVVEQFLTREIARVPYGEFLATGIAQIFGTTVATLVGVIIRNREA